MLTARMIAALATVATCFAPALAQREAPDAPRARQSERESGAGQRAPASRAGARRGRPDNFGVPRGGGRGEDRMGQNMPPPPPNADDRPRETGEIDTDRLPPQFRGRMEDQQEPPRFRRGPMRGMRAGGPGEFQRRLTPEGTGPRGLGGARPPPPPFREAMRPDRRPDDGFDRGRGQPGLGRGGWRGPQNFGLPPGRRFQGSAPGDHMNNDRPPPPRFRGGMHGGRPDQFGGPRRQGNQPQGPRDRGPRQDAGSEDDQRD